MLTFDDGEFYDPSWREELAKRSRQRREDARRTLDRARAEVARGPVCIAGVADEDVPGWLERWLGE